MRIQLPEAISLLKQGEVVAIPTETVYGLAADMRNQAAVAKIFALKKRPNDKPLITLTSSVDQVLPFLQDNLASSHFYDLTSRFWPGALTLVVPIKEETIDNAIRAGLLSAGFRVPNHKLTLQLLNQFGPVVAPSANLSGGISATSAEHVEEDFGKDFPVLDGGVCSRGIESTILCFREKSGIWEISRLGAIGVDQIAEILGYRPESADSLSRALKSKYAPKVRLHLSSHASEASGVFSKYNGMIPTVLGFEGREYNQAKRLFILGSLSDPEAIAGRLYEVLREVDRLELADLWVDMDFPRDGLLGVIAQRLQEASKRG